MLTVMRVRTAAILLMAVVLLPQSAMASNEGGSNNGAANAGAANAGATDAVVINSDARSFIRSLADQSIRSLIATNVPRAERIKRFRTLFDSHFAVRGIGKWILGRYWRRASKA